jgi:hypothetical protein
MVVAHNCYLRHRRMIRRTGHSGTGSVLTAQPEMAIRHLMVQIELVHSGLSLHPHRLATTKKEEKMTEWQMIVQTAVGAEWALQVGLVVR